MVSGEGKEGELWMGAFMGVYRAMRRMEGQKYQPPKYSQYCQDLAVTCRACLGRSGLEEDSAASTALTGNNDWEKYVQQ